MSVLPFTPTADRRREACRSAVYAALRQACRTQAYQRASATLAAVVRARMETRAALAEHDRLVQPRVRP